MKRYREWASFIDSVRGTLESLTIEQGTEPDENIHFCRGRPWQTGFPMDDRLLQYILPVLTRGPWPCLRKVEILGIGSEPRKVLGDFTPRDPSALKTAMHDLEGALGSRVALVFDSAVRRNIYQRSDAITYDS